MSSRSQSQESFHTYTWCRKGEEGESLGAFRMRVPAGVLLTRIQAENLIAQLHAQAPALAERSYVQVTQAGGPSKAFHCIYRNDGDGPQCEVDIDPSHRDLPPFAFQAQKGGVYWVRVGEHLLEMTVEHPARQMAPDLEKYARRACASDMLSHFPQVGSERQAQIRSALGVSSHVEVRRVIVRFDTPSARYHFGWSEVVNRVKQDDFPLGHTLTIRGCPKSGDKKGAAAFTIDDKKRVVLHEGTAVIVQDETGRGLDDAVKKQCVAWANRKMGDDAGFKKVRCCVLSKVVISNHPSDSSKFQVVVHALRREESAVEEIAFTCVRSVREKEFVAFQRLFVEKPPLVNLERVNRKVLADKIGRCRGGFSSMKLHQAEGKHQVLLWFKGCYQSASAYHLGLVESLADYMVKRPDLWPVLANGENQSYEEYAQKIRVDASEFIVPVNSKEENVEEIKVSFVELDKHKGEYKSSSWNRYPYAWEVSVAGDSNICFSTTANLTSAEVESLGGLMAALVLPEGGKSIEVSTHMSVDGFQISWSLGGWERQFFKISRSELLKGEYWAINLGQGESPFYLACIGEGHKLSSEEAIAIADRFKGNKKGVVCTFDSKLCGERVVCAQDYARVTWTTYVNGVMRKVVLPADLAARLTELEQENMLRLLLCERFPNVADVSIIKSVGVEEEFGPYTVSVGGEKTYGRWEDLVAGYSPFTIHRVAVRALLRQQSNPALWVLGGLERLIAHPVHTAFSKLMGLSTSLHSSEVVATLPQGCVSQATARDCHPRIFVHQGRILASALRKIDPTTRFAPGEQGVRGARARSHVQVVADVFSEGSELSEMWHQAKREGTLYHFAEDLAKPPMSMITQWAKAYLGKLPGDSIERRALRKAFDNIQRSSASEPALLPIGFGDGPNYLPSLFLFAQGPRSVRVSYCSLSTPLLADKVHAQTYFSVPLNKVNDMLTELYALFSAESVLGARRREEKGPFTEDETVEMVIARFAQEGTVQQEGKCTTNRDPLKLWHKVLAEVVKMTRPSVLSLAESMHAPVELEKKGFFYQLYINHVQELVGNSGKLSSADRRLLHEGLHTYAVNMKRALESELGRAVAVDLLAPLEALLGRAEENQKVAAAYTQKSRKLLTRPAKGSRCRFKDPVGKGVGRIKKQVGVAVEDRMVVRFEVKHWDAIQRLKSDIQAVISDSGSSCTATEVLKQLEALMAAGEQAYLENPNKVTTGKSFFTTLMRTIPTPQGKEARFWEGLNAKECALWIQALSQLSERAYEAMLRAPGDAKTKVFAPRDLFEFSVNLFLVMRHLYSKQIEQGISRHGRELDTLLANKSKRAEIKSQFEEMREAYVRLRTKEVKQEAKKSSDDFWKGSRGGVSIMERLRAFFGDEFQQSQNQKLDAAEAKREKIEKLHKIIMRIQIERNDPLLVSLRGTLDVEMNVRLHRWKRDIESAIAERDLNALRCRIEGMVERDVSFRESDFSLKRDPGNHEQINVETFVQNMGDILCVMGSESRLKEDVITGQFFKLMGVTPSMLRYYFYEKAPDKARLSPTDCNLCLGTLLNHGDMTATMGECLEWSDRYRACRAHADELLEAHKRSFTSKNGWGEVISSELVSNLLFAMNGPRHMSWDARTVYRQATLPAKIRNAGLGYMAEGAEEFLGSRELCCLRKHQAMVVSLNCDSARLTPESSFLAAFGGEKAWSRDEWTRRLDAASRIYVCPSAINILPVVHLAEHPNGRNRLCQIVSTNMQPDAYRDVTTISLTEEQPGSFNPSHSMKAASSLYLGGVLEAHQAVTGLSPGKEVSTYIEMFKGGRFPSDTSGNVSQESIPFKVQEGTVQATEFSKLQCLQLLRTMVFNNRDVDQRSLSSMTVRTALEYLYHNPNAVCRNPFVQHLIWNRLAQPGLMRQTLQEDPHFFAFYGKVAAHFKRHVKRVYDSDRDQGPAAALFMQVVIDIVFKQIWGMRHQLPRGDAISVLQALAPSSTEELLALHQNYEEDFNDYEAILYPLCVVGKGDKFVATYSEKGSSAEQKLYATYLLHHFDMFPPRPYKEWKNTQDWVDTWALLTRVVKIVRQSPMSHGHTGWQHSGIEHFSSGMLSLLSKDFEEYPELMPKLMQKLSSRAESIRVNLGQSPSQRDRTMKSTLSECKQADASWRLGEGEHQYELYDPINKRVHATIDLVKGDGVDGQVRFGTRGRLPNEVAVEIKDKGCSIKPPPFVETERREAEKLEIYSWVSPADGGTTYRIIREIGLSGGVKEIQQVTRNGTVYSFQKMEIKHNPLSQLVSPTSPSSNRVIEELITERGVWIRLGKNGQPTTEYLVTQNKHNNNIVQDPFYLAVQGDRMLGAYLKVKVGQQMREKYLCSGLQDSSASLLSCRVGAGLLLLAEDAKNIDEIRIPLGDRDRLTLRKNRKGGWDVVDQMGWEWWIDDVEPLVARFGPNFGDYMLPLKNYKTGAFKCIVWPYLVASDKKSGGEITVVKTFQDVLDHARGILTVLQRQFLPEQEIQGMDVRDVVALLASAENTVGERLDTALEGMQLRLSQQARKETNTEQAQRLLQLKLLNIIIGFRLPHPFELSEDGKGGYASTDAGFLYFAWLASKRGEWGVASDMLRRMVEVGVTSTEKDVGALEAVVVRMLLADHGRIFAPKSVSETAFFLKVVASLVQVRGRLTAKFRPLLSFDAGQFMSMVSNATENQQGHIPGQIQEHIQGEISLFMFLEVLAKVLYGPYQEALSRPTSRERLVGRGLIVTRREEAAIDPAMVLSMLAYSDGMKEKIGEMLNNAGIRSEAIRKFLNKVLEIGRATTFEAKNITPLDKEEQKRLLYAICLATDPSAYNRRKTSKAKARAEIVAVLKEHGARPSAATILARFWTWMECIRYNEIASGHELAFLFLEPSHDDSEEKRNAVRLACRLLVTFYHASRQVPAAGNYGFIGERDYAMEGLRDLSAQLPDYYGMDQIQQYFRQQFHASPSMGNAVLFMFYKVFTVGMQEYHDWAGWKKHFEGGRVQGISLEDKIVNAGLQEFFNGLDRRIGGSEHDERQAILQQPMSPDQLRAVSDSLTVGVKKENPAELRRGDKAALYEKLFSPLESAIDVLLGGSQQQPGELTLGDMMEKVMRPLFYAFLDNPNFDRSMGQLRILIPRQFATVLDPLTDLLKALHHRYQEDHGYKDIQKQCVPESINFSVTSKVPHRTSISPSWEKEPYFVEDKGGRAFWRARAKSVLQCFSDVNIESPMEARVIKEAIEGVEQACADIQKRTKCVVDPSQLSVLSGHIQGRYQRVLEEEKALKCKLLSLAKAHAEELYLTHLICEERWIVEENIVALLLERYERGHLHVFREKETEQQFVDVITSYLFTAVERQQLSRAKSDALPRLVALKKQEKDVARSIDWKIYSGELLALLEGGADWKRYSGKEENFARKYLVSDFNNGWVSRLKAIACVEKVIQEHVGFMIAIMGLGKTTFIFPRIAQLLIESGKQPVMVTTEALVKQFQTTLDPGAYLFDFDIDFGLPIGSPQNYIEQHLVAIAEQLEGLGDNGKYVVTTPRARAALQNKRVQMQAALAETPLDAEESESIFTTIELLKRIEAYFADPKTVVCGDEDVVVDISMEYNFATGRRQPIADPVVTMGVKMIHTIIKQDCHRDLEDLKRRILFKDLRSILDLPAALRPVARELCQDKSFWLQVGWNEELWGQINKDELTDYLIGTRSEEPTGYPAYPKWKEGESKEQYEERAKPYSYVAALRNYLKVTMKTVHGINPDLDRGFHPGNGYTVGPLQEGIPKEGIEYSNPYEIVMHTILSILGGDVVGEAPFFENLYDDMTQRGEDLISPYFKWQCDEWRKKIGLKTGDKMTPYDAFSGNPYSASAQKRVELTAELAEVRLMIVPPLFQKYRQVYSEQVVCNSQHLKTHHTLSGTGNPFSTNTAKPGDPQRQDYVTGMVALCMNMDDHVTHVEGEATAFIKNKVQDPKCQGVLNQDYEILGNDPTRLIEELRSIPEGAWRQFIYRDKDQKKMLWQPKESKPIQYDHRLLNHKIAFFYFGPPDGRGVDFKGASKGNFYAMIGPSIDQDAYQQLLFRMREIGFGQTVHLAIDKKMRDAVLDMYGWNQKTTLTVSDVTGYISKRAMKQTMLPNLKALKFKTKEVIHNNFNEVIAKPHRSNVKPEKRMQVKHTRPYQSMDTENAVSMLERIRAGGQGQPLRLAQVFSLVVEGEDTHAARELEIVLHSVFRDLYIQSTEVKFKGDYASNPKSKPEAIAPALYRQELVRLQNYKDRWEKALVQRMRRNAPRTPEIDAKWAAMDSEIACARCTVSDDQQRAFENALYQRRNGDTNSSYERVCEVRDAFARAKQQLEQRLQEAQSKIYQEFIQEHFEPEAEVGDVDGGQNQEVHQEVQQEVQRQQEQEQQGLKQSRPAPTDIITHPVDMEYFVSNPGDGDFIGKAGTSGWRTKNMLGSIQFPCFRAFQHSTLLLRDSDYDPEIMGGLTISQRAEHLLTSMNRGAPLLYRVVLEKENASFHTMLVAAGDLEETVLPLLQRYYQTRMSCKVAVCSLTSRELPRTPMIIGAGWDQPNLQHPNCIWQAFMVQVACNWEAMSRTDLSCVLHKIHHMHHDKLELLTAFMRHNIDQETEVQRWLALISVQYFDSELFLQLIDFVVNGSSDHDIREFFENSSVGEAIKLSLSHYLGVTEDLILRKWISILSHLTRVDPPSQRVFTREEWQALLTQSEIPADDKVVHYYRGDLQIDRKGYQLLCEVFGQQEKRISLHAFVATYATSHQIQGFIKSLNLASKEAESTLMDILTALNEAYPIV